MGSTSTRRIFGMVSVLLCSLSLGACSTATESSVPQNNSETAHSQEATPSFPQTAEELLNETTQDGSARAVGSWTLEGKDWSNNMTITYDDHGNITEQKSVLTTGGVSSEGATTVSYEGNTYAGRTLSSNVSNVSTFVTGNYEEPTYDISGEDATVTLTAKGSQSENGLSYRWSDTYTVSDRGNSVSKATTSTKITYGGSADEVETIMEGKENQETNQEGAIEQSITYSPDGNASALTCTIDTDSHISAELALTYDENELTVQNKNEKSLWRLTKDEQGAITKAVNEEAGLTLSLTYVDIANPTNFNRALAKNSTGTSLATALSLQIGHNMAASAQETIDLSLNN